MPVCNCEKSSRSAAIEQVVKCDRTEGSGADSAEFEAENRQLEIAGAEDQRGRNRDEILRRGKIDLVLDPDPARGRSDQAEDDDSETAQNCDRDRADHRAEFG